jgi:hypothetical protein
MPAKAFSCLRGPSLRDGQGVWYPETDSAGASARPQALWSGMRHIFPCLSTRFLGSWAGGLAERGRRFPPASTGFLTFHPLGDAPMTHPAWRQGRGVCFRAFPLFSLVLGQARYRSKPPTARLGVVVRSRKGLALRRLSTGPKPNNLGLRTPGPLIRPY